MNLTCPKCGTEETRRLSLVMSEDITGKGIRFGAAYMYNFVLPFLTIGIGLFFLVILSIFKFALGLFAFAGCLIFGYYVRKWVKGKFRPRFDDLPNNMKQNGFLCSRCAHVFLPAAP